MRILLRRHGSLISYLVLALLLILTLFPIFIMLTISLKSYNQYTVNPLLPGLPFHWENYRIAWEVMGRHYLNNVIIIGVSTVASLFLGSLTAYALARYNFPGRQFIFYAVLAVMAIPGAVILVPSFMVIVQLGVLNTRWALILPYTAHQSLIIFVFTTFFSTLPEEMFEAARLDGASYLDLYSRLVIPLSWPVIGSMGIFQVWWHWNDFVWPSLVLSKPALRTVAQALVQFSDALMSAHPEPGHSMAASVLASIPLVLLFLFSMRTFIAGMTAGAVKM